jgi:hypothetical protein
MKDDNEEIEDLEGHFLGLTYLTHRANVILGDFLHDLGHLAFAYMQDMGKILPGEQDYQPTEGEDDKPNLRVVPPPAEDPDSV